ncbi:hypothetical protein CYLTODRAFT_426237 [Cylindrobasidium torrendii FP15055 ss-10]|uniref:Uncharacterized protein n=1 Tax=Cylindrobasidium torrendii FP15055 ss-10 TaxID=1314674 RepID=A0A0D7AY43_9AGAR|nr:hypothetical protein CYLTODRAFT_426237 [Cylindrobasidium torrendii FP15055 ss-10]
MGSKHAFLDFIKRNDPGSLILVGYGEDKKPGTPSFFNFQEKLHQKLQLSEAEQEILDLEAIVDVDRDGEVSWILVVGNNSQNHMLSDEIIGRVKEAAKFEEEPQWWLDEKYWYWEPGPRHPGRAQFVKEVQAGRFWRRRV